MDTDGCGKRQDPTAIAVVERAELAEAASILDPAIACHVSRPFKSLAFITEMGGDGPAEVT